MHTIKSLRHRERLFAQYVDITANNWFSRHRIKHLTRYNWALTGMFRFKKGLPTSHNDLVGHLGVVRQLFWHFRLYLKTQGLNALGLLTDLNAIFLYFIVLILSILVILAYNTNGLIKALSIIQP